MVTCALAGTAVVAVGAVPAEAHHHHYRHHWHHHDHDSEDWSDYEVDHGAMILAAPVETPAPTPTVAPAPATVDPPAPPVGALIACASNLKDAAAIVRVEFDGPAFRQANLLNGDCQNFPVPVGPYHFTTPATGNNPCGLFTTLNVLIRRNGVNYKPTSTADFATWVEQGAQTRVSYFCG